MRHGMMFGRDVESRLLVNRLPSVCHYRSINLIALLKDINDSYNDLVSIIKPKQGIQQYKVTDHVLLHFSCMQKTHPVSL